MSRVRMRVTRIRWRMRRAPWRVKRAAKTVILLAIAVAAAAAFPPSIWRDAEHAVLRHIEPVEDMVWPAAERTAEWLDRQVRAVRYRLEAIEGASQTAAETGNVAPVRIIRVPAAIGRGNSARVVDGDTLDVGGVRIRLHGIDAPETAQNCRAGGRLWSCGREAGRALVRRIGGRPVACEERDRDLYGRVVAVCRTSGSDLNAWMVAEGWAFAYRRYSHAYVAEESRARSAQRGIWRGEVVAPWEWRRGKRLRGARPAPPRESGRCAIKGNLGKSGKRIYHVPGGRHYDRARIDPSKGERWFCSESEARAAGWRRSRL